MTVKAPTVCRTGVRAGNQLAIYLDAGPNVVMTVLSSSGAMLGLMRGYGISRARRRQALCCPGWPEHTASAITIGTVVAEALDHAADIDEFTFSATAGQQLEIYLQQLDPGVPSGVLAGLQQDRNMNFVGGAISAPPDGDIAARGSGLITVPATGQYHLVGAGSAVLRVVDDRNVPYAYEAGASAVIQVSAPPSP